jgi:hypothetical protein
MASVQATTRLQHAHDLKISRFILPGQQKTNQMTPMACSFTGTGFVTPACSTRFECSHQGTRKDPPQSILVVFIPSYPVGPIRF